jgi:hypothetical protein
MRSEGVTATLTGWLDSELRAAGALDRPTSARVLLGLIALQRLAHTRGLEVAPAWRHLRSQTRYTSNDDIKSAVDAVAAAAEVAAPELRGVFTSILAPDFRSAGADLLRWIQVLEGAGDGQQAHATLDDREFGDWLSAAVDGLTPALAGPESQMPSDIARLMTALLDVPAARALVDLRCGVGTLLASALDAAAQAHTPLLARGVERLAPVAAVARIRMYFTHANARIVLGDGLRAPGLLRSDDSERAERFDRVVVSVPLGLRLSRDETRHLTSDDEFVRPPDGTLSGDAAFIHRGLSLLRGTGKMVALVSPGFLFRGGADAELRNALVARDLVDAVINLPPNALPGTSMEPAVLVLNWEKPSARRGTILMADLGMGQAKGARRPPISPMVVSELTSLLELARVPADFRAQGAGPSRYSADLRMVTTAETVAQELSFHPRRYLHKAPPTTVPLALRLARLQELQQTHDGVVRQMDHLLAAWPGSADRSEA